MDHKPAFVLACCAWQRLLQWVWPTCGMMDEALADSHTAGRRTPQVYDAYRAAAKKYKGKLVFVTVDKDGEGADPVTNFFGLKESNPPVVSSFKCRPHQSVRYDRPASCISGQYGIASKLIRSKSGCR